MIPGTSETHTEGFPYEIFRHSETKYFQRKIVILLCIKFFDTPNFLKHWRDAHEIFWHCETKNLRLKIVILPPPFLPPPLIHNFFRYQIFSDTQIRKVPLRNFSALRQKKSTQNREINLWSIKSFGTRN